MGKHTHNIKRHQRIIQRQRERFCEVSLRINDKQGKNKAGKQYWDKHTPTRKAGEIHSDWLNLTVSWKNLPLKGDFCPRLFTKLNRKQSNWLIQKTSLYALTVFFRQPQSQVDYSFLSSLFFFLFLFFLWAGLRPHSLLLFSSSVFRTFIKLWKDTTISYSLCCLVHNRQAITQLLLIWPMLFDYN